MVSALALGSAGCKEEVYQRDIRTEVIVSDQLRTSEMHYYHGVLGQDPPYEHKVQVGDDTVLVLLHPTHISIAGYLIDEHYKINSEGIPISKIEPVKIADRPEAKEKIKEYFEKGLKDHPQMYEKVSNLEYRFRIKVQPSDPNFNNSKE